MDILVGHIPSLSKPSILLFAHVMIALFAGHGRVMPVLSYGYSMPGQTQNLSLGVSIAFTRFCECSLLKANQCYHIKKCHYELIYNKMSHISSEKCLVFSWLLSLYSLYLHVCK